MCYKNAVGKNMKIILDTPNKIETEVRFAEENKTERRKRNTNKRNRKSKKKNLINTIILDGRDSKTSTFQWYTVDATIVVTKNKFKEIAK